MKRRTIGILTLCAVLALLVLNWQTQPFHRLQDRNVVPLSVGIVRSDARGSKTVNLQGSQAVQALQACARRTVPLWAPRKRPTLRRTGASTTSPWPGRKTESMTSCAT